MKKQLGIEFKNGKLGSSCRRRRRRFFRKNRKNPEKAEKTNGNFPEKTGKTGKNLNIDVVFPKVFSALNPKRAYVLQTEQKNLKMGICDSKTLSKKVFFRSRIKFEYH